MRNCYRLLLMLAVVGHTVRGLCQCNSDGSSERTFTAEKNVYYNHSITCDEIPTTGLNCNWEIAANSASTIIAVEFLNTLLPSDNTDLNKAEFKSASGDVIQSVTSSQRLSLTPTTSSETNVIITLTIAANINIIPKLEFGFIAVATDNEDCQRNNGKTIELQNYGEFTISSGNFPSHYSDTQECSFTVTPLNGGELSMFVVFMSTEDECDDADPVTLTIDTAHPNKKCGRGFHQNEIKNIQSKVEVHFKADDSSNEPGWLMHFTQIPSSLCSGDPCNGGDCDSSTDSIVCTNCPSGKTGPRCEIDDVCNPNPCQGSRMLGHCNPCPKNVCNNCKTAEELCDNKYCKACCIGTTGKCRKRKRGSNQCRTYYCSKN